MKLHGLALLLLVATLGIARAQVTVELLMDQEQFLPAEEIPVRARVVNRSGRPLHLGADNQWLSFSVEARDNPAMIVSRLGEPPVEEAFDLQNSMMATKTVDIAPYFLLTTPGRYAVTAVVRIPGWDREIVSAPKVFTIADGTHLWEREIGVPQKGNASQMPEVRKYILHQANYIKNQIRLYLRITDSTGLKTLRVLPIGPMISFGRPEPQVDRRSNLHVLYQNGPRSFSYTAYNPDGDLIRRQTYDYTTRPKLRVDDEGEVFVAGGVRRFTPNDIPPPPPEESTNTVAVPTGSVSNTVDAPKK